MEDHFKTAFYIYSSFVYVLQKDAEHWQALGTRTAREYVKSKNIDDTADIRTTYLLNLVNFRNNIKQLNPESAA